MKEGKNIRILQVFRGLAASLVVLFHIILIYRDKLGTKLFIDFFKEGFIGVEFFFILSGFIIFYAHRTDFGKRRVGEFFIRRFRRIYLPYWAALVAILASYTLARKNIFHQFPLDPASSLKMIVLFPQWPHIIAPAWTLSYEIYFYLILGAALFFLSENLTFVLSIIYAIFLVVYNYAIHPPTSLFIPTDYFTLSFLYGIIAAWIYSRIPRPSLKISIPLFALSIIYLAAAWTIYEVFRLEANIYRPLIFGIPLTTLMLSSVWLEKSNLLRSNKLLCYLGDMSYSLYLLHSAIITFAAIGLRDIIKTKNAFLINSTVFPLLAAVIVLSWLFHWYVERPLLKLFRLKQPGVVKGHLVEAVN